MTERINLAIIAKKQEELDLAIIKTHQLAENFETFLDKLLALIVEVAELANETKCFKYWMKNKHLKQNSIFEEYADCMHFFLSIGNSMNFDFNSDIEFASSENSLEQQFLNLMQHICQIKNKKDVAIYRQAILLFLSISFKVKLSSTMIIEEYNKKNKINHIRQKNKY